MSKFGLVIQGPLVSFGRKSGKTAHVGWRKIPEQDWVAYDCRENIRAIIENFGHLFDAVVVSTWRSEVKPGDGWEGAVVIASDDELLPKKQRKDEEGRAVPDNRFRQMFSTLAGVECLEKHSSVDIVVKVRTDQYFDLGRMLEFIKRAQTLQRYTPEVVFVPSIMKEDARYAILDFYFAGTLQAMKDFARSFFEYGGFEFHESIHRELWLKYAYVAHRERVGVPEYAYFPSLHGNEYCAQTLKAFQYMVQHVFWPMSFACFQTLVWRGEPFGEDSLEFERRNNIFQETPSEKSIEEICRSFSGDEPHFLAIDWQKYARFRKVVLTKPLSAKEQAFAYANRTAGSSVRFAARTGYFLLHPAAFFAGAKRRFLRLTKR